MKITRAGVDIAKSIFHVHGVDRHGQCSAKQSSNAVNGSRRCVRGLSPAVRGAWKRVRAHTTGHGNFSSAGTE
jgi:transposase